MKAAVGDDCAIALRFSSEDLLQIPSDTMPSEAHEVVALLADLPDLWDVKSSSWTRETVSARFSEQGAQEPINSFVKALTKKPVVGVGRFTSPDMMVSQINRGILDLIGAARPSIADPFLPNKINAGQEDEIRECIGCNICVSGYHDGVPVRCTQNPTMGEEWRRKWHPERIPAGSADTRVLIVGAGPAGLECARAMGVRGFAVTLAEARDQLGGRVSIESSLPGLSSWARVRDYRTHLLQSMANVEIYRGNKLTAQDIGDFDCEHAVIATGAHWSAKLLDSRGHASRQLSHDNVFTPDDILSGRQLTGPVVIFDFDHYYMGSCLAELLCKRGLDVTIVTTASAVSAWTFMNNELADIRKRMIELGVGIVLESTLADFSKERVEVRSIYPGGPSTTIDCAALVVVGHRVANDAIYAELLNSGIDKKLHCIGDCRAPGAIAHAVYSGHECARTIDAVDGSDPTESFAWERPQLTRS
jgi:dimethylamine/trimethylamine dehydrogenase